MGGSLSESHSLHWFFMQSGSFLVSGEMDTGYFMRLEIVRESRNWVSPPRERIA